MELLKDGLCCVVHIMLLSRSTVVKSRQQDWYWTNSGYYFLKWTLKHCNSWCTPKAPFLAPIQKLRMYFRHCNNKYWKCSSIYWYHPRVSAFKILNLGFPLISLKRMGRRSVFEPQYGRNSHSENAMTHFSWTIRSIEVVSPFLDLFISLSIILRCTSERIATPFDPNCWQNVIWSQMPFLRGKFLFQVKVNRL